MKAVSRADLLTFVVTALLVAVAAVVGLRVGVQAATPPLYALWDPHTGPGTPAAILIGLAVVVYGVRVAERLPWRGLLATAYATSVAWTLSLALVDGWQRGIALRLTFDAEYLSALPVAGDIPTLIRTYASRILDLQPDSWNTQAAGHPPGALLVFAVLDRIGLGGGAAAGLVCIAVGGLAAVAVPATLRSLSRTAAADPAAEPAAEPSAEGAARAVVPFAVLFPGAVWVGTSGDGLFLGVTAVGIALLAAGLRRPWLAGLAGVVLGFGCFLSYGLILMAPLAIAVAVAGRRLIALVWTALGVLAVVAAFALAGFWWPDGYALVKVRYYHGIAALRPYWYWVWANLAALALSAGPAAFVAARRGVTTVRPGETGRCWRNPAVLLGFGALTAILVADLSGLSKAEVERIWLPFAVWLLPFTALLPRPARPVWLGVQAVTALAVNHLLITVW